jgi:hypothetical protein
MNVTYHIVLQYHNASFKLKTNASEFSASWQHLSPPSYIVCKPSTLIHEVTIWLDLNNGLQH